MRDVRTGSHCRSYPVSTVLAILYISMDITFARCTSIKDALHGFNWRKFCFKFSRPIRARKFCFKNI